MSSHNARHKSRSYCTVELRGQEVEIDCHLTGEDPDVGLQRDFEDEIITGDSGVLDWELTDEEREKINRCFDDQAQSMQESWFERGDR
jgi:hypothetical protein